MAAVQVAAHSSDPVSRVGLVSMLAREPQLRVVDDANRWQAEVAVVVEKTISDSALSWLREFRNGAAPDFRTRVVLVIDNIHMLSSFTVTGCGIAAVLHRQALNRAQLVQVVTSVSRGAAYLPPAMQGELLAQIDHVEREVLAPKGLTVFGVATRERDVLRLLSEGFDTEDIAAKLSYSERTIKNVLHQLMSRYQLKSRAHAVAFAVRAGIV